MGIKVITDSTACLDKKLASELEIIQVSLSVNFPDKSFKELDITNEFFYNLMDKSPRAPTSSQPSPAEFYQTF